MATVFLVLNSHWLESVQIDKEKNRRVNRCIGNGTDRSMDRYMNWYLVLIVLIHY